MIGILAYFWDYLFFNPNPFKDVKDSVAFAKNLREESYR
jgi:hypothetical protein